MNAKTCAGSCSLWRGRCPRGKVRIAADPICESPESYPGCYGDYGNPIKPNVCRACTVEVQCLRSTMEAVNQ